MSNVVLHLSRHKVTDLADWNAPANYYAVVETIIVIFRCDFTNF